MNRLISSLALSVTLMAGFAGTFAAVATAAQQDPDELRRDEEEILRKSERLRDLMETLLERYRAEGRTQHVKLLEDGLLHLTESGLLEDVAGIRDSLQDRALTEALQRQGEVVADLEQLLAILRDRRSVESLQQEMEAAAKLAAQASELLRQQSELRTETSEKTEATPSPAERALLEQLRDLAQQQRAESERNSRDAGARARALEDALRRVQALLRQQQGLEASAQRETSDPSGAHADPVRQQGFRLGELAQQLRDQRNERSANRVVEQAANAARELEEAIARNDAEAVRQALARLQSRLAAPGKRPDDPTTARLDEWRERLEKLGGADERATLEEAARDLQQLGARGAEGTAGETAAMQSLAAQIEQMVRELASPEQGQPSGAGSEAAAAAEALRQAAEMTKAGRDAEAQSAIAQAEHALDAAREQHQNDHPDARQLASRMASETAQVAQSMRHVPAAEEQEPGAETAAAQALGEAEKALRGVADLLQPTREQPPAGADVQREVGAARNHLEAAAEQLSKALGGETAGRESSLAQAAARQQELARRAAELQQQLDSSASGMSPEQQRAAAPSLQQAQESMQRAQGALAEHQQATAGAEQEQAADALEQAMDATRHGRPLSEEQNQALAELAQRQEQLEKDIIQLAREVEERKNQKAQRALEQASSAASRASKAMREGDAETADAEQQQAEQQLQEAAQALEEEKDRYQDLRQEELLFRLRDELQSVLEKQRPITESTREIAATYGQEHVARRVRRQLNELGTQESELASKTEYLRTALDKEASLVFSHVLNSNQEDLEEVARRLAGQQPDPGELTVMLQQDVETRTQKLIDALKREQERRRQNQGSGQQQDQNANAREALVPVLAELQMLKQMELDMMEQTRQLQSLVAGRGDAISGLETTLIERLASRHNDVTRIFMTLKGELEKALHGSAEGDTPEKAKEEEQKK